MKGKSHTILLPALLLGFWVFLVPFASAQQAENDAAFVAPHRTTKPTVETSIIEKPAPFDITGIVAQAFNMKKPLRLISPLAPAKEGNGHENVSWDPDKPEKPKGIILFGIQW
jgi:hypothetical protein